MELGVEAESKKLKKTEEKERKEEEGEERKGRRREENTNRFTSHINLFSDPQSPPTRNEICAASSKKTGENGEKTKARRKIAQNTKQTTSYQRGADLLEELIAALQRGNLGVGGGVRKRDMDRLTD